VRSREKISGASDSDGANSDSETSRTRGALEHVSAKQSQEPAPENVRSREKISGASDSDGANSDSKTSRTRGALEHVSAKPKQSQEPAPENVRSKKKRKRFPKDQRKRGKRAGANRSCRKEQPPWIPGVAVLIDH
jgi:hypothetical protein